MPSRVKNEPPAAAAVAVTTAVAVAAAVAVIKQLVNLKSGFGENLVHFTFFILRSVPFAGGFCHCHE